jgi:predicted DNA-binding protein with PD1-like motif
MKTISYKDTVEVIVLGLEPGEFLLESINEAIREHNIQNGAVVSGIGTLKTCRMHYILHTDFPPQDAIFTLEEPLELLTVNGIIADGEPHLHGIVSRADEGAHGGHIEPGCEVAYLAEIVIHKYPGLQLERRPDPQRKIKLLGPKE